MNDMYFKFESELRDRSDLVNIIFNIYHKITDKVSKQIFANCVMYSLTGDSLFIHSNILLAEGGCTFNKQLEKGETTSIYIYGAGQRGRQLMDFFPDKNWGGYIDREKRGMCNGMAIISVEDFTYQKGMLILVSVLNGYEEIKEMLIGQGVPSKNIIVLEEWNKMAHRAQYFERRCIDCKKLKGGIVDAGAYDGADTLRFGEVTGRDDYEAWVFEPDINQKIICEQRLKDVLKAQVFGYGLADIAERQKFEMNQNGLSKITEDGKMVIETITLDSMLKKEEIGFIKMDIEGFEEKAITGARDIITEQKPALAISVYHKRTDIWRIPNLLLKYNPEYRFALGHYSIGQVDTVLYAF